MNTQENKIVLFKDRYSFLSNFEPCKIVFNGISYLSSEAAFQAQKCTNNKVRMIFAKLSPPESKVLGRNIIIRPDWEEIKYHVMLNICKEKFSHEPFKSMLIETGDSFLMEGNYWHDNIWGSCFCERCKNCGENSLGKILMDIRTALRTTQPELF